MAMVAPTDRSMPSVPMTSAMPRATMATGTTWMSCRRRLPTAAKLAVKARLNNTSTPRATYTPRSPSQPRRSRRAGSVRVRVASSIGAALVGPPGLGDQLHDAVLADLVAAQRPHHRPVLEHHHRVRALDHLLELRGDEQDAKAFAGQVVDQALDLGLGPDVDPPGWLVEDQHLGVEAEDPGQEHLLLVAAGELGDRLVGAGGLDPEAADERGDELVLAALGHEASPSEGRQRGQDNVLPDREVGHDALGLAVLGEHGDPGADGGLGRSQPQRAAGHADRAVVERLGPEDRLGGLGAPRAEQSGQTDDLTPPDPDRHAVQHVPAGETVRLQHRPVVAPLVLLTEAGHAVGLYLGDVAAEHGRDQPEPGDRGHVAAVDQAAVPQYGHPLAELEHLVELVGDVEHRS